MSCLFAALAGVIASVPSPSASTPPFKMLIDTEQSGSSDTKSFILPLDGASTYNFTVNWGDASTPEVITANTDVTHEYATAGTYTVSISENVVGGFPAIYFNAAGDCLKVMAISAWGTNTWASFNNAFNGCANLTITAIDAATAGTAAVLDFSFAWMNCTSMTTFPVINMRAMTAGPGCFDGCPLTLAAYSAIIIDLENNSNQSVSFGASLSFYGASAAGSHNVLKYARTWNISDLGVDPDASLDAFRMTIDTTKGNASKTFVLPLNDSLTYYFAVAWGDGVIEIVSNASTGFPSISHTYANHGTYAVSILYMFPAIYFNGGGDRLKVTALNQWGLIQWGSFNNAFNGCANMVIIAEDYATAVMSAVIDFSHAWEGCSSLDSFPLLPAAGNGNDYSYAWKGCTGIATFPLMDFTRTYNLAHAWEGCTGLISFPLIEPSQVSDFRSTWSGCTSLTSFPTVVMPLLYYGEDCFLGSALNTGSYTLLLNSLDAVNSNTEVTFGGGASRYSGAAVAARANLVDVKLWVITDGGPA